MSSTLPHIKWVWGPDGRRREVWVFPSGEPGEIAEDAGDDQHPVRFTAVPMPRVKTSSTTSWAYSCIAIGSAPAPVSARGHVVHASLTARIWSRSRQIPFMARACSTIICSRPWIVRLHRRGCAIHALLC